MKFAPDPEIRALFKQHKKRSEQPDYNPPPSALESLEIVPEKDLGDVKTWLDQLANEEQSNIDSMPEFTYQPLGHYTTRDNSSDASAGDVFVPFELGLDTDVLRRIEWGDGPLLARSKDLVEMLRETDPKPSGEIPCSDQPYEELLEELRAWNKETVEQRYGTIDVENPDEAILEDDNRDELIEALSERRQTLASCQKVSRDECDSALNKNTERVQRAFIACRPEVAEFADRSPYSVIVIWIANHLVATPRIDTDDELWMSLFKTLLAEANVTLPGWEVYIERKERIKSAQDRATDKGEKEQLKRKEVNLNKGRFLNAEIMVLDDLKRARRNLRQKKLEELEGLTAAQAGQKRYMTGLLSEPHEILEEKCDGADEWLQRIVRQLTEELDAQQLATQTNMAITKESADRSYTRVKKFSALDIKDPEERRAERRRRMARPETSTMMLGVTVDSEDMRKALQTARRHLSATDALLPDLYSAAKERYQAYDLAYARAVTTKEVESVSDEENSV